MHTSGHVRRIFPFLGLRERGLRLHSHRSGEGLAIADSAAYIVQPCRPRGRRQARRGVSVGGADKWPPRTSVFRSCRN